MRTTVTLDDDLVAALKQRANEREISFKLVLNDAIRAGLANGAKAIEPYRMKPARPLGLRPGIDYDKGLQLAAEIEDEEIVRKLRERR